MFAKQKTPSWAFFYLRIFTITRYIRFIGTITNDSPITAAHCCVFNGANCNTEPPNDTINAVHATIPTATAINIGLVRSRANKLNPSVRTQNPFTTAMMTSNANRADISVSGVPKIFCMNGIDISPNTATNPIVIHATCAITARDNNGAFLPCARSAHHHAPLCSPLLIKLWWILAYGRKKHNIKIAARDISALWLICLLARAVLK